MRATQPGILSRIETRRVLGYTSQNQALYDPSDDFYSVGNHGRESLLETLPDYGYEDHKEAASFHTALAAAYKMQPGAVPACTAVGGPDDPASYYWVCCHQAHAAAAELHRQACTTLLKARSGLEALAAV